MRNQGAVAAPAIARPIRLCRIDLRGLRLALDRVLLPAVTAALLGFVSPTAAQNMDSAQFEFQPLQYMAGGEVAGCGARLYAVVPWGSNSRGRGVDVSVNVRREAALVKAIAYEVTVSGSTPAIRNVPIDSAWLRAPGGKATRPTNGKTAPGETPESILYVTDFDAALEVLGAILKRQPIQVGMKRKAESGERIFYGPTQASDNDLQQLAMCLRELAK